MKKSLLALAVLGAFAGVANAQTNVTVYGVADIGFGRDRTLDVNKFDATRGAKIGNKSQMLGNSAMNNGNSRLGFRGTEDLGGGLKASFNFEQGINLETGATEANTYARQANVSLGGNWGTVTFGRQFNAQYHAIAAYDLTGTANYSLNGRQFGYPVRTNSLTKYTSPNFNGFTAMVEFATEHDLGATDPQYGLGLIYKGGPISASLSYTRLSAENPVTGDGDSDWTIGGAYDFGMFKVAASYLDLDRNNSKGFTLGASTNFGPVTLTFDAGRQTEDVGNEENTDYLLEAKYSLSKRTFVYGAFYHEGEDGGENSFGLGLRHNF